MNKRTAIVLAAGKGTRMKSHQPKVLHTIAGEPLIAHVLAAVTACGVERSVVVIGHGGEAVQVYLGDQVDWAWQREQLGTGHAVMAARPQIPAGVGTVLVVCGDTPLLTGETLARLVAGHEAGGALATVLTALVDDPTGYGRVIRDQAGKVIGIVEEKDATPAQKQVREINAGTYCFNREALFAALAKIKPANVQGEYYLTDVLAILRREDALVAAQVVTDSREVLGINDRRQLAVAEAVMQERLRAKWLLAGVTMVDPTTVWLHRQVKIGADTVVYPQTILEGETIIGSGCVIGPATRFVDSQIGDQVVVQNAVVLSSRIGDRCTVGPFAYLRPGTVLAAEVKVGDFAEIKNSVVGKGSKVPHLAYVGDATIGAGVNIGCGTITCNYDGEKKHPTVIGDGVFVGSNTNLVAPVTVGDKAFIGAGSTITKDVPAGALAVERAQQIIKEGYRKRLNQKKGGQDG
ncbi:MAG: bifunctional UDP-N-acetylglucosamine diphosphorylase/glucosamine-1-phosphate N-acetyltransferase GlmU [Heliobacteriaceae bacterium]|nr:bifunctional UDP-N-acetylglucosamine diphosphorylase/glucosamine-1-phosphate N-acetyltransferase GlmU [Heliobacteriaceae bacterium]